ncbi:MAG: family 43 glycosylhydrolase [Clostridia bacterium]|nr:family 43 glycosylhydrolase [Clostridia bacterium]
MKLSEINIRDPFLLLSGGVYYLYGTRGPTCWGAADGFDVYVSEDMEAWSGPNECFHAPDDFWADRNFWAPEVHVFEGNFYMFASFKKEGIHRGTAILKSTSPMGPFHPHSDGCVTPGDWECLDGTLYVDAQGQPYLVFCHEWVQVGDGEICAVKMSRDLKRAEGEPFLLFHASSAKWCEAKHHSSGMDGYVTDGPFMYRCADGTLLLLWASFSSEGYTEAVARSLSGEIQGPWVQEEPLFWKDGGHGMVLKDREGHLLLTIHSPNEHLKEHPVLIPLAECNGRLKVRAEDTLPEWAKALEKPFPAGWQKTLTGEAGAFLARSGARCLTPEDMGYTGGLATHAIQKAVDTLSSDGGGTVVLSRGDYLSGTISLKSGVVLRIERGARLLGSTDLQDYPEHVARRRTVQDTSMGMHQSLIVAEDCDWIGLCGDGEIDFQGTQDHFPGAETAQGTPGRPFGLRLIDCRGVVVKGLLLRNSACWMQNYLNCEDVLVEHLTVRNHANYNNDGIDIDGCRRVIVRHCSIHSGDDALCFKGAAQAKMSDVLVEDCELLSACNAVKIGTDTQGDFSRIEVRKCTIGGLLEDPSGLKHPWADSGISLEMMDGGTVEDISLHDLEMIRVWSPFFFRLEDRGRVQPGETKPGPGTLRRVLIEHVRAVETGPRGSYMLGIPEKCMEKIVLRDIRVQSLAFRGQAIDERDISDLRGVYPDAHMIDDLGPAPGYGLWARHVKELVLDGYRVVPEAGEVRTELVLTNDAEYSLM